MAGKEQLHVAFQTRKYVLFSFCICQSGPAGHIQIHLILTRNMSTQPYYCMSYRLTYFCKNDSGCP